MADRALAFAEDPETGFARAALLEEAYSRLDARHAERETAIMSMREHVHDGVTQLLTEGASSRYDHARGRGHEVEERLRSVRDRARSMDVVDEAARCSATLAVRFAFRGELVEAEQEVQELLRLAEDKQIVWAAVDAWQTLAVVRQTRGELAAALDARRAAARAARAVGLQEREAMLTINLGFALTTIGAKQEALNEIESGMHKAQAIGSTGAVRHGQMILLCWAATFGAAISNHAKMPS